MGGIEFQDENGKWRSVCLEGGVIPFGEDSDVEAFERWQKKEEGRESTEDEDSEDEQSNDEDSEHYLSDKYPWNPETEMRGGEDDYIDYCFYEKCRYDCYRQFWYSGKHDCCICQVISCKQCARQGGRTCPTDGCKSWICGRHSNKKCPKCVKDEKKKEDDDRKPAAKKAKRSK